MGETPQKWAGEEVCRRHRSQSIERFGSAGHSKAGGTLCSKAGHSLPPAEQGVPSPHQCLPALSFNISKYRCWFGIFWTKKHPPAPPSCMGMRKPSWGWSAPGVTSKSPLSEHILLSWIYNHYLAWSDVLRDSIKRQNLFVKLLNHGSACFGNVCLRSARSWLTMPRSHLWKDMQKEFWSINRSIYIVIQNLNTYLWCLQEPSPSLHNSNVGTNASDWRAKMLEFLAKNCNSKN